MLATWSRKTERELLRIVNLGRKTLRESKDTLAGFNLHLGIETGSWVPPGLQCCTGGRRRPD